jgi:hypothetical protein
MHGHIVANCYVIVWALDRGWRKREWEREWKSEIERGGGCCVL